MAHPGKFSILEKKKKKQNRLYTVFFWPGNMTGL